MAKQKREINEEFADVWSEIVSERVEVLKQKLMEETDEKKSTLFRWLYRWDGRNIDLIFLSGTRTFPK